MTQYPAVVVLNEHDRRRVQEIVNAAERLGANHIYTVGRHDNAVRAHHYADLEEALDNIRGTWVPLELTPGATPLAAFEHPSDAIYLVGPQSGYLPPWVMNGREPVAVETGPHSPTRVLPTPVVVGVVLHHRLVQMQTLGLMEEVAV